MVCTNVMYCPADLQYEPPAKRSHVSPDVRAATRDQRFHSADELNRQPDFDKKRDFLRCLQLQTVNSDVRTGKFVLKSRSANP